MGGVCVWQTLRKAKCAWKRALNPCWCSNTFLNLTIAFKILTGRCMCLERALSPCFSVLVFLIDVSYSSKGLNDCCMCLADLNKKENVLGKGFESLHQCLNTFHIYMVFDSK